MAYTIPDFGPSDLLTSDVEGFRRIRVDVAQTGFFEGREFRMIRKIDAPVVFRFTSPVDFILSRQAISFSEGDVEFYAWRADNVIASGTWSPVLVLRKNLVNTAYIGQATVTSGGEITVTNPELYADYDRVKTASATGQRVNVDGQNASERYLSAGTYYLQFVGAGIGSFNIEWEEKTIMITVEDGTGITGANAYIDVAFVDAWALSRAYDLSAYDTTAKEAAVTIASSDWIDLYHNFKGAQLSEAQGLKMPTDETVYDDKWRSLVANAAYLQLKELLLVDESAISVAGTVESESKTLGPLSKSVSYTKGTAQTYKRKTPSLDAAIRQYLSFADGLGTAKRW